MLEEQILNEVHTPCFIFDQDELRSNFKDFQQALASEWGPKSNVAYSVKTNPFPWILEQARSCGCMAEVVSDEEYDLALSTGFKPEEIIFNGPIKSHAWFEYAVKHGSIVNIDSNREIEWACELAQQATSKNPVKIGVRVNVDLEAFCPGETITGKSKGRFGFSYEDRTAHEVIRELISAGVTVSGLHMHVTTLSRSNHAYEVLANHAVRVIEECELKDMLEFVDIGGGFYGGGAKNQGAYDAYAKTIAAELRNACNPGQVALYVEPGGAVVCTPGYYVGKVIDTKDICGKRFVVTELSRLNIDHEMKKTSYPFEIFAKNSNTVPSQTICGFTCLESDRLCQLDDEVELSAGDLMVIKYAGAYSMSFTPGFFIQYAPAVYSHCNGKLELLREPFSKKPPAE